MPARLAASELAPPLNARNRKTCPSSARPKARMPTAWNGCLFPVGHVPWLWSGFSTRKGGLSRAYCSEDAPGELNLGFTDADEREAVSQSPLAGRGRHGRCGHAACCPAPIPFQSDRPGHAGPTQTARSPGKADGQMTDEPGFLLAMQTADCIPVLVADRKRRAVAAFHAGWRGTVKRIVETGVWPHEAGVRFAARKT